MHHRLWAQKKFSSQFVRAFHFNRIPCDHLSEMARLSSYESPSYSQICDKRPLYNWYKILAFFNVKKMIWNAYHSYFQNYHFALQKSVKIHFWNLGKYGVLLLLQKSDRKYYLNNILTGPQCSTKNSS